jgi:dTDP-4-amino-4,6-dideoxygalactose transaminase
MNAEVRPFQPGITEDEIAEFLALAADVLRSGRLILGEQTERFEAEFAAVTGTTHSVAVSTGTVALEILHRATGGSGRKALVPANTNYATAAAALHAGAQVSLYDAGLYSTTGEIAAALDRYPEAHSVTVVHLGGYISPELDAIAELCRARGVLLFEDAAHAHGSTHHGRPAGSLGDAAAFSFYPTKVLTTGEGGAITTDDPELAARCRTYRDQGKDATGELHIAAGSSWRMPEISAALGRVLLRRLPATLAHLRGTMTAYTAGLRHSRRLTTIDHDPAALSGHKYVVLAAGQADRDRITHQASAAGVQLSRGVYTRPLHRQPILATVTDPPAACAVYPLADDFADRHLCLPLWRAIPTRDVARTLGVLTTGQPEMIQS